LVCFPLLLSYLHILAACSKFTSWRPLLAPPFGLPFWLPLLAAFFCLSWLNTPAVSLLAHSFGCLRGYLLAPPVGCPLGSLLAALLAPSWQHSTAQHSTAQHSTAQHSTAQHSNRKQKQKQKQNQKHKQTQAANLPCAAAESCKVNITACIPVYHACCLA